MPSENKTYLITGVGSGLGKFLYENLPGALGLSRDNKYEILDAAEKAENLVVLHAAFNTKRDVTDYSQYIEDNIFLTEDLLYLYSVKFVYFSSIDVYGSFTPYSFMKRCAEDFITKRQADALILRLPAILGPTMRKNSLIRLMEEKELTLHSESIFNYVLQNDILEAVTNDELLARSGTYNFVASEGVRLLDLAEHYNKNVRFGHYTYETSLNDLIEVENLYPYPERTSSDVVELFLRNYYE
tara:strand:+ start:1074 stop:1799 length:726 start_codon:yes stop_codon:yes gene_type:complete